MYHRQPSNHPTLLKQNQLQNQCPFNFLFPLFKRKKTFTNCLKLELRRYPFFQNLFPMTIYPTSKIDTGSSCWISSSSVVNQVTINTVYIAGIIEGKNELDFTNKICFFINSSPPPLNARHPFGETQLVEVTEANAGLPVNKVFINPVNCSERGIYTSVSLTLLGCHVACCSSRVQHREACQS